MPIVNIAAYKFVALSELAQLRARVRALCVEGELKGTVLLSPEGINLFLAGAAEAVERFQHLLRAQVEFADLDFKQQVSASVPFERLLVKIKREIIPMGDTGAVAGAAPRIAPRALKAWLDDGRPLVLLDTRNAFEVARGSFQGALHLNLRNFREFERKCAALDDALKRQPIVTFCTGGIRCEKAAPLMLARGFREVYQLDGGILRYFEHCGGVHYEGDCFVFDERVVLDSKLQPVS